MMPRRVTTGLVFEPARLTWEHCRGIVCRWNPFPSPPSSKYHHQHQGMFAECSVLFFRNRPYPSPGLPSGKDRSQHPVQE